MVTQSTSDGSLLDSDTVQRPLTVTAPAADVDVGAEGLRDRRPRGVLRVVPGRT